MKIIYAKKNLIISIVSKPGLFPLLILLSIRTGIKKYPLQSGFVFKPLIDRGEAINSLYHNDYKHSILPL